MSAPEESAHAYTRRCRRQDSIPGIAVPNPGATGYLRAKRLCDHVNEQNKTHPMALACPGKLGVNYNSHFIEKISMHQIDGEFLLDGLGIDHFKSASALGALSDQAIAYLMKKGRVYALNKGDTLFEDGGPGDTFFIILKGSFAYYLPVDNHRKYIRNFDIGMEIGFVSMIALTSRPGTAIATMDSYVLEVTTDLFYAFHCERPLDFGVLLMNLCRELARRILERQERDSR